MPKTIINYSETANEALFVLKHNQYIFVRRSTIETIASEELIDIDEFISFFDNILTNQDKKAISKAKRNNKKRKNYYMKMANGINILLYNIKKKELQALISIIKNNI
ncbi:MAG: hypothetical protein IJ698_05420 [Prevotella sp.]|nr:hypothetical protein [Prevotella sp.]